MAIRKWVVFGILLRTILVLQKILIFDYEQEHFAGICRDQDFIGSTTPSHPPKNRARPVEFRWRAA
jgi:hypothetical protein